LQRMGTYDYSRAIAKAGLEIRAIKLSPDKPFQWASGFFMPIYNDNRMFLNSYENRQLIARAFSEILGTKRIHFTGIAGTSTAGIPHAEALADRFKCSMIYVRDKPKDHGLRNQIEGIDAESHLSGSTYPLIEDLISTGGSSVSAVQAIRDANGSCFDCLSIFNYGFQEAVEMFQGKRAYDKEKTKKLSSPCNVHSILDYHTLLEVAEETGYVNAAQMKMLKEWRADPFKWGENHGFPKVEKK